MVVVFYAPIAQHERTPRRCDLSHTLARTRVAFDDPHLVSHAGLVPVMASPGRAGLRDLAAEHVRPGGECRANPGLKVACLVVGTAVCADSIDDMGLLRHGAAGTLFDGLRPRPRWGSYLRSFTWGNVRQVEKVGREFLAPSPGRLRCCPARASSRSWTSTPRKSASTAIRSRARSSDT